jgi:plastocyanin
MQTKRFLAFPFLCLVLALAAFAAVGCGGNDGDDTGSVTTSESGGTAEEGGGGSTVDDEGGNEPAPGGDAVRSAKVEIEDFEYYPDPVTIEEGGKVIWQNEDSAPHTATAEDGSFDTGTLEEGKLKSESFKEPGTYAYICSIHPQMEGTVEVVAAG